MIDALVAPSTNGTATMLALPSLLPGQLHEAGIDLPPNMSFDEWEAALHNAEWIERAAPWWVVDLIAYGKRFGEDASQALPTFEEDQTNVRQAKLKQAAWMAERWPASTRVPAMSYTHHRIAAGLSETSDARAILVEASQATDQDGNPKPWSTRELSRHVDARQRAIKGVVVIDPEPEPALWPNDPPAPDPLPTEPPADAAEAWLLIADLAAFLRDEYLTRIVVVDRIKTRHDRHCDFGKGPGCGRRCRDAQALLARAELVGE